MIELLSFLTTLVYGTFLLLCIALLAAICFNMAFATIRLIKETIQFRRKLSDDFLPILLSLAVTLSAGVVCYKVVQVFKDLVL